jgi:hypothetical protein
VQALAQGRARLVADYAGVSSSRAVVVAARQLVGLTGFTFDRVQREINQRAKAADARAALRPASAVPAAPGAADERSRAGATDTDSRRFADTRLRLLACVLHEPGLLGSLTPAHRAAIDPQAYPDPASQAVASAAWSLWDAGVYPSVSAVLTRLDNAVA